MKVRKTLVLGLVVLLLAALSPTTATAKRRPRTASARYNFAEVYTLNGYAHFGGARFKTFRGEKKVSLHVEDAVSVNMLLRVSQNLDKDAHFEIRHEVCGVHTKPLGIKGGHDVVVHFVGTIPPTCGGGTNFVTTGTIHATFTR